MNYAPEYFVTVHISQALHAGLEHKTIFLESSVNEVITDSGSTKKGRQKKDLRSNGRFDIYLTRKNQTPWCPIEVKSPVWTWTKCIQDMKGCATPSSIDGTIQRCDVERLLSILIGLPQKEKIQPLRALLNHSKTNLKKMPRITFRKYLAILSSSSEGRSITEKVVTLGAHTVFSLRYPNQELQTSSDLNLNLWLSGRTRSQN